MTQKIIHSLYISEENIYSECMKLKSKKNIKIEVPFDLYGPIRDRLLGIISDDALVQGKFNLHQVINIVQLKKITMLEFDKRRKGVILVNTVSVSVIILFCCLMWSEDFVNSLDQSLEKQNIAEKGLKNMKRRKYMTIDKIKLGAKATAFIVPKAISAVASGAASSTIVLVPIAGGILSSVDVYRYFRGTISKTQLTKNVTVIGAGLGGGLAGGVVGAAAGAAIGSAIVPVAGSLIGGVVGAFVGGGVFNVGASYLAKKTLLKHVIDDSDKMILLFQESLMETIALFIMSPQETESYANRVKKEIKLEYYCRDMFKVTKRGTEMENARTMAKIRLVEIAIALLLEERCIIDIGKEELETISENQDNLLKIAPKIELKESRNSTNFFSTQEIVPKVSKEKDRENKEKWESRCFDYNNELENPDKTRMYYNRRGSLPPNEYFRIHNNNNEVSKLYMKPHYVFPQSNEILKFNKMYPQNNEFRSMTEGPVRLGKPKRETEQYIREFSLMPKISEKELQKIEIKLQKQREIMDLNSNKKNVKKAAKLKIEEEEEEEEKENELDLWVYTPQNQNESKKTSSPNIKKKIPPKIPHKSGRKSFSDNLSTQKRGRGRGRGGSRVKPRKFEKIVSGKKFASGKSKSSFGIEEYRMDEESNIVDIHPLYFPPYQVNVLVNFPKKIVDCSHGEMSNFRVISKSKIYDYSPARKMKHPNIFIPRFPLDPPVIDVGDCLKIDEFEVEDYSYEYNEEKKVSYDTDESDEFDEYSYEPEKKLKIRKPPVFFGSPKNHEEINDENENDDTVDYSYKPNLEPDEFEVINNETSDSLNSSKKQPDFLQNVSSFINKVNFNFNKSIGNLKISGSSKPRTQSLPPTSDYTRKSTSDSKRKLPPPPKIKLLVKKTPPPIPKHLRNSKN